MTTNRGTDATGPARGMFWAVVSMEMSVVDETSAVVSRETFVLDETWAWQSMVRRQAKWSPANKHLRISVLNARRGTQ